MPFDELQKKLFLDNLKKNDAKIFPNIDQQEDPVPYDEDAGTLTNLGRFAINNLSKDQGYGNMLPVVGGTKIVGKLAQEISPEVNNIAAAFRKPAASPISGLLNKGKSFLPEFATANLDNPEESKDFMNALQTMKQSYDRQGLTNGPSAAHVQAAVSKHSANLYRQGVDAAQEATAAKNRFDFLKNQIKE